VALEAGRAQFIILQERYIFNAGMQGYWLETEHQYGELGFKLEDKFFDKQGRSVRGQLLFSESDVETVPGPPAFLEKPSERKDGQTKKRPRPQRNKAKQLLRKMFPGGMPSKDELPDRNLRTQCIGAEWKGISDDTICASGRRVARRVIKTSRYRVIPSL